ncbi:glycoside hydrolase family 88 protein [Paenibacillus qinlingensis]|uniref:glycoside hydrolase family 88 protein n=1 Tax=Paenibacillus qinlingensis TaxID=1837343 RepID=UPI00156321FC|nr:glycoside hydrolase family 88 protein [Paenibacillus qinlingensis]NQX63670.1 glycoside hydrolase family 88 protein [Paenibacillus qinlingensis]
MNNLSTIVSFITDKTRRNAAKYGDLLPTHTKDGVYEFSENGFWTGLNWLSYELTGDEGFIRTARDSYPRLLKRLYDTPETLDHDIGFLYSLSFVADYKITGNPEALKVALDAADRLAERFNEKGQFQRRMRIRA